MSLIIQYEWTGCVFVALPRFSRKPSLGRFANSVQFGHRITLTGAWTDRRNDRKLWLFKVVADWENL